MTGKPLSVNEVLRHVHHDFVNELQIIKMHLALNDAAAANQAVDNVSAKFTQFSRMNGLQSERLVEWLHTCQWRFSSIEFTIESNLAVKIPTSWDTPIRNFLEETVQHVHPIVDPMHQQNCEIYIMSTADKLEILFTLSGKWELKPFNLPINSMELIVEEECYSDTLWRYRVIGSKEGI